MSTKTTIHAECTMNGDGFTESEIHVYWEPGINTESEGIYLYAFRREHGDVLVKIREPKMLAERLLKHFDPR